MYVGGDNEREREKERERESSVRACVLGREK